ncbi:hypothetical protein LEL_09297 [Akanthomyces lecanii RCEF 1005]|uniref:DUF1308 domain-containing protein n=1 Tax=Akanthomyces lecanii RCEF 1005 TaxID=1081108 RepID=A0A162JPZ2_CORDF|nr:hypothetical protein LEL_09297 [Akanthomyces lecanii RCEF 1005]
MAMDDCNNRQDDRNDEGIESRREELVAFAKTHLDAGLPCVPELEALLAALTPKVKAIHATGLISFVRDLKHDVDGIEAILQELQPPESHDGIGAPKQEITRAGLDAIWKRLEPRTTGAYHSTTRWQVLRRCANLIAFKRTFQGSARDDRRAAVLERGLQTNHEKLHMHRVIKEQSKIEVAVVDRGAGWIDLRWISADRLSRQMTDSGWSWGEYTPGDEVDRDEWEDVPFVKQVRRAVAAARLNRHEYRIPTIRLVLPNLARGTHGDIDVLLDQLPRIDPGVDLVVEDATCAFLTRPAPSLADTIRNLVGDSLQVLTDTLNLEHTVLVDLISDLTHLRLAQQPWQSRTTRAQIAEENAHPDGVMAPLLYPLLQGRRLVCTHEAAEHFHEMLTTVGTATERERGRLLVPYYTAERRATASALRTRFNALSERLPPVDVQFPVEILPADEQWDVERVRRLVEDEQALPPVALDIVRRGLLKSSKLSTYMHGWRHDIVTVTSNKEIRAHMKTWVEAGRRADDERGPQLYCVEVTRNLLAKSAMPPPGWVFGSGTDEWEKEDSAAV